MGVITIWLPFSPLSMKKFRQKMLQGLPCRWNHTELLYQTEAIRVLEGLMMSSFSGSLSDAMKRLNHLAPWNHERRWIAFRLMQDANAALAQQSSAPGEGGMTHEVHLQTGNGNDRGRPTSKGFTQDTGGQCVTNALCPFVDCIKRCRHDQDGIRFGQRVRLPWQFVIRPHYVS